MTVLKSKKLYFTTELAHGAGDYGPVIATNILVLCLLVFPFLCRENSGNCANDWENY
ncbi:MAG: hypothetical protein ACTMUB_00505 [cyanobacterium endosymbiont of Rhopalodia musculus]|uniref:hypothetical protein n=1 Tax=cyanobacterium endosymbiont of Epithemia clementina EcSB TaxID=3034674 RepID=UPI00247FCD7D|nr:hypothetical protein [cyanobacterium endosymbiont of Epithemia clementina EcSB]WGT66760.1 hypothetical protein P3F56_05730 [cyanobacterium endosymbiont of Epithemia clementina EcSB]